MAKVAGDILYFRGDIVTIEADGEITKGDFVHVSGASAKAGIHIKVAFLPSDEKPVCGFCPEDISDGELGPMILTGPVVFATGEATVTIGALVGYGSDHKVSDMATSYISTIPRGVAGIAWKGVAGADEVIPIQLLLGGFMLT